MDYAEKAAVYAKWLVENQDKKGTPEFEKVAQAYRAARMAMDWGRRSMTAVPNNVVLPGERPGEEYEFDPANAVKNIPASAKELVKGVAKAVAHPIETGKAVGNIALGAVEKLIPGEQESEPYAEAFWNMLKDRYGSKQNFLSALEHDPVGVVADASALLTGVGGAARAAGEAATKAGVKGAGAVAKAGKIVGNVGKQIDPIVAATNAARAPFHTPIAKRAARKVYEGAAKFTESAMKKARRGNESIVDTKHRLAEQAMDMGVLPTYKGIQKLDDIIAGVDMKLDDLAEQYKGKMIPTMALTKRLREYRKQLEASALAPEELATYDRVVKDSLRYAVNKWGKAIPAEDLQRFKTETYKRIDWSAIRGEENAKNVALKALAGGAKDAMEQVVPEIRGLNEVWGKARELQDALQQPAARLANRSMFGARSLAGAVAGAASGGAPGAATGAALLSTLGPETAARAAIAMHKLGSGWWQPSSVPWYLFRQGLLQQPKIQQIMQQSPFQQ